MKLNEIRKCTQNNSLDISKLPFNIPSYIHGISTVSMSQRSLFLVAKYILLPKIA